MDVPVPAGTPGASTATPVQGVPSGPGTGTRPGPGWGSPGPSVPTPSRPATPAPSAVPPAPIVVPAIPPHPGPYRIRQRSLADMANEQLRRGKPKDPLAEGMEGSAIDDCLHAPQKPSVVGGLLALPGLAARALSDRCAK
jgi:hypothetical protein